MSTQRVAGQALPRLDGRAKVTGEYIYGMDFTMPGMLHGKVLRSPHPHARIVETDVRKASALPGVRAILTGQDVPALLMPGTVWDQPLLAYDRVRYAGEPVALIAADRPEVADEAARLIEITYEPLPVLTDPEAAMQPGAMLLHENWASYQAAEGLVREGNVCCHATLRKGDVARGFAEADLIVDKVYTTPFNEHAYLEPEAGLSYLDEKGRMVVVSGCQAPHYTQQELARILG